MNGLVWTMLVLAAMIGSLLFATVGAIVLALLLGNVSDRLTKDGADHHDY